MFKKQLNPNNVILFCICVLLLIGCQPTTNQDNETILTTRIIANEPETAHLNTIIITPTRSISQTTISTRTPILLPTNSATPQPTPTALPTETPTPTPTPWPTLSPDDAANKLLSLLADNQNPDCLLPCWWGATPGQTLWQDIEPVLRSVALEIHFFPEEAMYVVVFPVEENVNDRGQLNIAYKIDPDGILSDMSIASVNIASYDPATMMTLYGAPDEVWLKSMTPRDIAPFHLILVYQALGFSLHYYVNATTTYETYTACFSDEIESVMPETFPAGTKIRAWVPGQHQPIYNIVNIPWEQFYPLEEVTNLTPQTVYDTFVTAETPCIHTPAQFWEGQ